MTLERQQEREYLDAELRLARAVIKHNDLTNERRNAAHREDDVLIALNRLYDLTVHELIDARDKYLEMNKARNGWT